jgi:TonB-dependent starch-binding outer membrane protein SusC
MAYRASRSLLPLTLCIALAGCASGGGSSGQAAQQPGVTADDVQRSPNIPIEQLLQSKVPGIVVSRTEDGGVAIRIRGASSFNTSNAPLYVIDGTPTSAGPGGAVPGINPYDIDTIKVLKDPAELTMYGSRGANGVIVIRTKRSGKTQ